MLLYQLSCTCSLLKKELALLFGDQFFWRLRTEHVLERHFFSIPSSIGWKDAYYFFLNHRRSIPNPLCVKILDELEYDFSEYNFNRFQNAVSADNIPVVRELLPIVRERVHPSRDILNRSGAISKGTLACIITRAVQANQIEMVRLLISNPLYKNYPILSTACTNLGSLEMVRVSISSASEDKRKSMKTGIELLHSLWQRCCD